MRPLDDPVGRHECGAPDAVPGGDARERLPRLTTWPPVFSVTPALAPGSTAPARSRTMFGVGDAVGRGERADTDSAVPAAIDRERVSPVRRCASPAPRWGSAELALDDAAGIGEMVGGREGRHRGVVHGGDLAEVSPARTVHVAGSARDVADVTSATSTRDGRSRTVLAARCGCWCTER